MSQQNFQKEVSALEVGDLIRRVRSGKKELSAVLATSRTSGRLLLTLSPFSSIITATPHPKAISLDSEGWLVDEGGAVFLLPEEWEGVEKDGARELLQKLPKAKNTEEKMEAIAQSLDDPRIDLEESAEDVLRVITGDDPSKEQVQLLCFAFQIFMQSL